MSRQNCADHLFLLGEMLGAASQYTELCGNTIGEESFSNVEVAYARMSELREFHADLGRKLDELETRLRVQLRKMSESAPTYTKENRKAAKGS
jgi:hypothetical protein